MKNPVAAKTFSNISLAITPLLTPDKLPDGHPQYLTNIMNLIKNAQKSVYIQLQYIESSKGDGSFYEQLLQTIADKIAQGKDIKLIESARWGLPWVEKMKMGGGRLPSDWKKAKPASAVPAAPAGGKKAKETAAKPTAKARAKGKPQGRGRINAQP